MAEQLIGDLPRARLALQAPGRNVELDTGSAFDIHEPAGPREVRQRHGQVLEHPAPERRVEKYDIEAPIEVVHEF
jgi:hypothetical protein